MAALPPDVTVASTYPATLYSASGHDVVFVPPKFDRMSGVQNDQLHAKLVEVGRYADGTLSRVDGLQPGVG